MKNRLFKLFAFALAVMMLVVSVPSPVSAASVCTHENAQLHHYSYDYSYYSERLHEVCIWAWYLCPDCDTFVVAGVGYDQEAHTFGSVEFTGNHRHSGMFHIYETATTCAACKYVAYDEASYPCSGDGINCPIFKG